MTTHYGNAIIERPSFLETESRQEGFCRSISSKKSCEDADQITDFCVACFSSYLICG